MTTETLTVRMSRSDPSIIWGFRLQGGMEINTPLTISKVVDGSLAERAGLVNGDHVAQICGRQADQMYHRDAQNAIAAAGNDLELIIERIGSKIWKPSISTTGDPFSPVKYSLAHHEDMLQEDLYGADKGFSNSSDAPHLPFGSKMTTEMSSVRSQRAFGNAPPPPPPPPQQQPKSFTKTADSYLRETGGLFGTDPNVQKQQQSNVLHSETLRLIRESEENKHRYSAAEPGGHCLNNHANRQESEGSRWSRPDRVIHQSSTFKRIMAMLKIEPVVHSSKSRAPFEPRRQENISGTPVCETCGRAIHGVFCKAGDKCYHGDCFTCSTCGTRLKNIGHYVVNEKLYCDIHARQQRQDHFKATGPQDPSIFSYRGGMPQVSPKHNEPLKAFYQPEVLKPSHSPIPHVYSAPLSPQSRGIPTHATSQMPGSVLRQAHEELDVYQAPSVPPASGGGGSHLQSQRGAAYQDTKQTVASEESWRNEQPKPTQRLSLQNGRSVVNSTNNAPLPDDDKEGKVEPKGSLITTAGDVVSAHLAFVQHSKSEVTSRTVGSYVPRRGHGVLKQLNELPRVPICEACQREIRGAYVLALSKTWCPDHFTCAHPDCRRKLLDVGFVEEAGFIYCEFCFEKYLAPSCNKCHQAVVGDTLTALEKKWHPQCFCCVHCHQPFGNSCFFLEEGIPYCEKGTLCTSGAPLTYAIYIDWNLLFTTKCSQCQFPIEAGDRWVEALGNAYHSNCFCCTVCQRSLEGQNFYVKGGHPYCKAHV